MGKSKGMRAAAVGVTAFGLLGASAAEQATAQTSDSAIRARADAMIAQMTPEEKAAQLTTLFALPQMQKLVDQRAASGAGSFLFVTDPKETNRVQRLAME
jgi:beta-glucosidase